MHMYIKLRGAISALGACLLLAACSSEATETSCHTDGDCKGERVCQDGRCADPQGTGGSSTGTGACRDINGTMICLQGSNAGYNPAQGGMTVVPAPTAGIPPSASIDTTGIVIGNQGQFGSCVAFATRNAMGARATAEKGQWTDFSVPDIWHVAGYGADACGANAGSSIGVVIGKNVQNATYVVPANVWPYNTNDCPGSMNAVPSPDTLDQGGVAFIGKAAGVSILSLDDIKSAIAQGWPPVIGVPVYADGPSCLQDGWWSSPDIDVPDLGSDLCGSHAVMLVSYDDVSSTVRFMNSWGQWGDGGYGTFTYAFLDQHSQGGMAVQHLTFKGDACPTDFCSTNDYSSGAHCQGTSPGAHAITCGVVGGCKQIVADSVCSGGCNAGQCAATCTDECGAGTTKCLNASTMQICGNYDADSCVEWGGNSACGNGCDSSTGQCKGGCATTNACGGCSALANQPGTVCGCNGTYQCSGQNATVCQGSTTPNACGGCSSLAHQPGSSCAYATCQNGTYQCSGQNATTCGFSSNASNGTACSNGTCQNGACVTCSASTYWTPAFASDTDSVGMQSTGPNPSTGAITVNVREAGAGLEAQVCKVGSTFSNGSVALSIYDAATNSTVGVASANLAVGGQTCSSWVALQNSAGYAKGQVFGGSWQLVSPASSASQWGWPYGSCVASGNAGGTCWSGLNITMTRTCK